MKNPRIRGLLLAASLFGCDTDKNADTGDEADSATGDESSGGATDDDTEPDTTAESDTTETSTMGPEDSEGPPTPEDFRALCEQQTDRASCEAVPSEYYPWSDNSMWCAWWVEVPVELVGDTCNFGEPQPRCVANSASEAGCGSTSNACGSSDEAWSFMDGDAVIIGRGEICTDDLDPVCNVDAEGIVHEGVPECACLCDPAFPL